jgi:photoactive yellow protein
MVVPCRSLHHRPAVCKPPAESDMTTLHALHFSDAVLLPALQQLSDAELDNLDFGVIGFDASTVVRRYNALESRMAGLSPQRVLGHPLFTVVAPCMNNFMVAQRFVDAATEALPLDVTIDYVLTLRMRPIKVKLRLLSTPGDGMRYVLVLRPS